MKNAPTIFLREMRNYFVSPIAYVALIVFTLLTGYFFAAYFNMATRYEGEANLRMLFHNMSITMLFLAPLITMRLLAEEKKSGTIEVLLTSPVTDAEVVIGKFAASMAMFIIMLILTFLCPLFLMIYGNPDIVPMIVGYLGLILLGGAFMSLGVVTSSLTDNQIVAALISFVMLLGLWVIGWMSTTVGSQVGKILSYISLMEHFDDFSKGVMDTKHVIYYISFTVFCLFLAIKSVQSAKWK
ncbi:ABC transporter permease subunit [Candidatus Poribacteria bacterium]|nr:ABC transporter permease subunit [Candidatus Poribacteria bacterium]